MWSNMTLLTKLIFNFWRHTVGHVIRLSSVWIQSLLQKYLGTRPKYFHLDSCLHNSIITDTKFKRKTRVRIFTYKIHFVNKQEFHQLIKHYTYCSVVSFWIPFATKTGTSSLSQIHDFDIGSEEMEAEIKVYLLYVDDNLLGMSETGFEARKIMFMSGHRCETSLKYLTWTKTLWQFVFILSIFLKVTRAPYLHFV